MTNVTQRETTPTGVPIEHCEVCDRRHPITRGHCQTCGGASVFAKPTGYCHGCRPNVL